MEVPGDQFRAIAYVDSGQLRAGLSTIGVKRSLFKKFILWFSFSIQGDGVDDRSKSSPILFLIRSCPLHVQFIRTSPSKLVVVSVDRQGSLVAAEQVVEELVSEA